MREEEIFEILSKVHNNPASWLSNLFHFSGPQLSICGHNGMWLSVPVLASALIVCMRQFVNLRKLLGLRREAKSLAAKIGSELGVGLASTRAELSPVLHDSGRHEQELSSHWVSCWVS
jgi:hypothetical protein